MVTALLNPKEKKTFFDLITLGTMAIEVGLFFTLPTWAKQTLFIFVFFFWRLAYNAGLGALLKYQSDSRGLVRMAKKYKIFDQEANPKAYRWLKTQLSMKMGDDYDFAVSWFGFFFLFGISAVFVGMNVRSIHTSLTCLFTLVLQVN